MICQDFGAKSDSAAKEVIKNLIFYFGRGMANLITIFDPDVMIIGGGVSNLLILYTDGVNAIWKQMFNKEVLVPIVQSQLGYSSGTYGAALIAG